MREYAVTFTVETEIEAEAELERVLRAALDAMPTAPHLDYSDLEIAAYPDGEADDGTAIAAGEHDFSLGGDGSILILSALTDEAKAWVEENVSKEGYNPDLPNRVYIEPRYVDALLDGIDGAGLTVDAIERALAAGGARSG